MDRLDIVKPREMLQHDDAASGLSQAQDSLVGIASLRLFGSQHVVPAGPQPDNHRLRDILVEGEQHRSNRYSGVG